MDDVKCMIEEILGECLNAEELCEAYAEIYSYTKEQMKFCINNLANEVKEND